MNFYINYITWFHDAVWYLPDNSRILSGLERHKKSVGYNKDSYRARLLNIEDFFDPLYLSYGDFLILAENDVKILYSNITPWFVVTHKENPFKMDSISDEISMDYKKYLDITIEGKISCIDFEKLAKCKYVKEKYFDLQSLSHILSTHYNSFTTDNQLATHILWKIIYNKSKEGFSIYCWDNKFTLHWSLDESNVFEIFDCFEGDFTVIIQTKVPSSLFVYSNKTPFYYIKDKNHSLIEIFNNSNLSEEIMELEKSNTTYFEKGNVVYWKAKLFIEKQIISS